MECQEVNVWAGDISHRVHALEAAINPLHTERVNADSAALADRYRGGHTQVESLASWQLLERSAAMTAHFQQTLLLVTASLQRAPL